MQVEGSRLRLNVEPTGPGAWLRAQLLSVEDDEPLAGYAFGDCRPLTEDDLDADVHWEGRSIAPQVRARPLRLHLQLRRIRSKTGAIVR